MSILFDNFYGMTENFDNVDIPVEEHMNSVGIDDQPYIVCEFAENMYKLEAGLYIADAMLEQRSMAGEDVTALAEGAVRDFIDKAIDKIKEFAGKVKAWFLKVIENVQMLATSGAKLKSKHGAKLRSKAKGSESKGFEYNIPTYDLGKLATMESAQNIKETYALAKEAYGILGSVTNKDFARNSSFDADMKDMEDVVEKLKDMDKSELRDEFMDKLVDEVHREGDEGDIGKHIDKYLDYIANYKKAVDSIKKAHKNFETYAKKIISSLEKFANKNDTSTGAGKLASECVELGKGILKVMNAQHAAVIKVSRKAYKDIFGVVRRLIVYKPKKESYVMDDSYEESMLENALNLI